MGKFKGEINRQVIDGLHKKRQDIPIKKKERENRN